MSNVLAVFVVLLVCVFLFFQIRGFIRDIKKRKELKKQSAEKLEKAEAEPNKNEDVQHEQNGDSKASR